jgi:hypothetical protein
VPKFRLGRVSNLPFEGQVMEPTSDKIAQLRQLLSQCASAKRMATAHSKRLGTVSDTQMLRDQLNSMLSRLKHHLQQGGAAAAQASQAVLEFSGPENVKSRYMTNVQQMERQLMAISNDYPALVRNIAAKQQEPLPTRRVATKAEDIPLLRLNSDLSERDTGQAQMQKQANQSVEVSQLEVQQVSQDIRERDQDIHELVGTAIEIQQVAADIASLIDHQAATVDQVAVHIENVSHNVDMGTEHITQARTRQRKFRIDCLGWVLIVLGVMLGAYIGLVLL